MSIDPSPPGPAAAAARNRFGFRLLGRLIQKKPLENILISPASLASALAMVHSGAGGETREQIAGALSVEGPNEDKFTRSGAAPRGALEVSDPQVRLAVANGIWVNTGLHLSPAFQERARACHAAHTTTLEFSDPRALEAINRWISDATGGKIAPLVARADLAPPAGCVLASAIYFKGLWQTPFDPELTRDGMFTLPGGGRKSAGFMMQAGQYAYLETQTFQAVSLPYGAGRFSMDVVLPAVEMPLEPFLLNLGADEWEDWILHLQETRVELMLPRSGLAYAAEMRAPLSDLGIKSVFGPGADLSPMGLSGHFIGVVRHAARAEINEEGTEIAAATAASLVRSLSRPVSMQVNRPFFCAIRDRATGYLLFMGAIVDP